jgi:hypothetical protein
MYVHYKTKNQKCSVVMHILRQQYSLLSQASWDRLEMKPKRDEKQGDT